MFRTLLRRHPKRIAHELSERERIVIVAASNAAKFNEVLTVANVWAALPPGTALSLADVSLCMKSLATKGCFDPV